MRIGRDCLLHYWRDCERNMAMKTVIGVSAYVGLLVGVCWLALNTALTARDFQCTYSQAFNMAWLLTAFAMSVFSGGIAFIVACVFSKASN